MPTDPVARTAPARSATDLVAHLREPRAMLAVALVAGLLLTPFGVDNFWLRVLTTAIMYGGLAQALNVMVGLCGYPALGNVVFFGVGAYTAGLLANRADVMPLLAIAAGAIVAAFYAGLASRAMLSLRGSYFLMATVALNAMTLELVIVLREHTRGALGVGVPPLVVGSPVEVYRTFYYLFLVMLAIASVTLLILRRSRLGYGLLAIKGNEQAAVMLGVPTFRYKAVAWAVSAGLSGAIGGIYAHWIGFIDPGSVFDLIISLEIFLMVLLGGRWLIVGPVVGALVFESIGVFAWREFTEAHLAVLGALIVALVMFLPGGLPELPERISAWRARARAGPGVDQPHAA